jgi:polyphosphate kinase
MPTWARTARIYTDTALLTAREPLTREVAAVFRHLSDRRNRPVFRHLMMAPLGLRSGIEALIDKEIENALKGRQASILLKLNSLEDTGMVRKLYHASNAGVRVRLIVRGICCLVTEVPGLSDRIEAISIVDRYLEHARVFVFGNAGDPLVYLSSADLMERNLDRRVEVAFPVLEPQLKQEVLHLLELQWNDRVKARVIDAEQGNPYRPAPTKGRAVHAQAEIRKYIIGKERA